MVEYIINDIDQVIQVRNRLTAIDIATLDWIRGRAALEQVGSQVYRVEQVNLAVAVDIAAHI